MNVVEGIELKPCRSHGKDRSGRRSCTPHCVFIWVSGACLVVLGSNPGLCLQSLSTSPVSCLPGPPHAQFHLLDADVNFMLGLGATSVLGASS